MDEKMYHKALETFAHNVAWLRRHHGISKRDMAKLLRIGVGTLNKIENGEIPLSVGVEIFYYIQQHFEIQLADQLERRLGE